MYTERSPYRTQQMDTNLSPKDIQLQAPCLASYEQYRTGENLYASIQENLPPPCSNECRSQNNEICTCKHEIVRETPRDTHVIRGTGSGPYSSLDQSCAVGSNLPPEPISPTSRSECSSIFPETPGRPYYVLDPREGETE